MQLASFNFKGADLIGLRRNDAEIIILDEAAALATSSAPTMLDMLAAGAAGMAWAEEATSAGTASVVNIDDVSFQPPVRQPGKIVGVAMNNSASNERKISAPDHPAFFLKPASCLVGHLEAVRVRPYYGSVHPEPELAVVIGRKTRDADAIDVMKSVFGYTIFNDVTGNGMRADDLFHYWALYADDGDGTKLERREQHLSYAARYKGSDTFGCMGPWLVTADEIPDPDNLGVRCSVGGQSVAEDNTRYYNYKVAELVSYVSQFLTLWPGDIISCGTAFKASPGRKSIHHANLQKVQGPMEVSIDGLGTLTNPVVIEDQPIGRWRLDDSQASRSQ